MGVPLGLEMQEVLQRAKLVGIGVILPLPHLLLLSASLVANVVANDKRHITNL